MGGAYIGNRVTMRHMLTFAHDHGMVPEVELMPMSQINEGIQRVKDNKARYRLVLFNELPSVGSG